MPFEIPTNIHPDAAPLAWLIGTWRGNGHGDYPTIEPFQFGQEVIFQQDGRPFIQYLSRSWIVDADGEFVREAAQETGFIRCRPERKLEFVLCHASGFAEVWYGEMHPERPSFEIVTDAVVRTESAKEVAGGQRLYGYVEGDLMWTYDMAAVGQPLQPHLWARLERA
jgi:THAP4-like, heme-binding beta-barrel domain